MFRSFLALTPLNMENDTKIKDDIWNFIETNNTDAHGGGYVSNDNLDKLFRNHQKVIQELCGIDDDKLGELNEVIRIIFTLILQQKLNQTTYKAICDMKMTDDHLPIQYKKGPTHQFESKARIIEGRQRDRQTKKALFESISDNTRFAHDQYFFWVPSFGKGEYSELDKGCILPIHVIQKGVASGSFGDIDKVKVHYAHLKSEDPQNPVVSFIPPQSNRLLSSSLY